VRSLTAIGTRIERLAAQTQAGLTDEDRACLEAWQARVAERWHGGPPLSPEQQQLMARAGFWQRLQRAWARPAFARVCLEAIERQRTEAGYHG
jgi:hypothetical protein